MAHGITADEETPMEVDGDSNDDFAVIIDYGFSPCASEGDSVNTATPSKTESLAGTWNTESSCKLHHVLLGDTKFTAREKELSDNATETDDFFKTLSCPDIFEKTECSLDTVYTDDGVSDTEGRVSAKQHTDLTSEVDDFTEEFAGLFVETQSTTLTNPGEKQSFPLDCDNGFNLFADSDSEKYDDDDDDDDDDDNDDAEQHSSIITHVNQLNQLNAAAVKQSGDHDQSSKTIVKVTNTSSQEAVTYGVRDDTVVTTNMHKYCVNNNSAGNKSVERAISEEDFCCICLDTHTNPKVLHKCSHKFCTECIDTHFAIKPVCPVCFVAYGVITGTQPEGYMNDSISTKTRLPGYEQYDTIVVSYGFSSGIQSKEHPNPGQPYEGTSRTGYLPNNGEGRKVLRLLKESFKRRLTFTVGRSRTTGAENVVTWNDIHHKTCTHGGQQSFGYPDPTYLQRVQEELAAFGVTEESIEANK